MPLPLSMSPDARVAVFLGAAIGWLVPLTGTSPLWSATRHFEKFKLKKNEDRYVDSKNECTLARVEQERGPLLGCCYPRGGDGILIGQCLHSCI